MAEGSSQNASFRFHEESKVSEERWFQQIDLGDGEIHPGQLSREALMLRLEPAMPDFAGKRVLEMGCAEGFFSFLAEGQGAREIDAFDIMENCVERAKFAAEKRASKVAFFQYDAELPWQEIPSSLGIDLILCLGLIYHLRNPYGCLGNIKKLLAPGGQAVIETALLDNSEDVPEFGKVDYAVPYPMMRFWRGKEYNGDDSNWWTPNEACMMAMFDSAGFEVIKGGTFYALNTKHRRGSWLVKEKAE